MTCFQKAAYLQWCNCCGVVLAGIVYDHGFALLDDVPAQLWKVSPELAAAASVIAAPDTYWTEEHPTEFDGDTVADAPPVPSVRVSE